MGFWERLKNAAAVLLGITPGPLESTGPSPSKLRILKSGPAMRVIFFYPGEEGTYVDQCDVTVYENGIVYLRSPHEETCMHLQNCEILWKFHVETDERAISKVRLLKPKADSHAKPPTPPTPSPTEPTPPGPENSPQA